MEQKKKEKVRLKKSKRSPRKRRQQERKEKGNLSSAQARLRHLRMAPRKARSVVDQIRGKLASEAIEILEFSHRAVAVPLLQLLKSAIANAEAESLNVDTLHVSKAWVDGGPILKRFMPRAMGRAARIHKRTSHITLVLTEKE